MRWRDSPHHITLEQAGEPRGSWKAGTGQHDVSNEVFGDSNVSWHPQSALAVACHFPNSAHNTDAIPTSCMACTGLKAAANAERNQQCLPQKAAM